MAFITWTDKMSVNVAQIDKEHQKLIAMINDLFDAMQAGHSKEVVRPTLEQLVLYAKVHFGTEEQLFQKLHYPNQIEHLAEHRKFIDQINQFIRDFKAGKVGLSLEIMNFLKQWLSNHIMVSDKKYTELFNAHGVN